jgi:hypothetical protein
MGPGPSIPSKRTHTIMFFSFGRRGQLVSLLAACVSASLLALAGCDGGSDPASPKGKEVQSKQEANIKDFYAKKAVAPKK